MAGESVQSLERALAILTLLSEQDRSVGVTEIARHLQLAKSTVHRLLSTLEGAGFVSRAADARYRLGLKLWEMGCATVRGLTVRGAARPIMEDLTNRTGETVHLSVWDQGEAVYIDKVDGTNPIRLHSTIGGRAPAHATASGLALLAFQDAASQGQVYSGGLQRYTQRTIVTRERLRRRLAEVRRDRYACSAGAWHVGSAGVAAPIRAHTGKVIAALSVAGPTQRILDRCPELAKLVRDAAEDISRTLGDPSLKRPPESPGARRQTRRGGKTKAAGGNGNRAPECGPAL
jgi:DNA-binding IclR family transcriptional regulator